MDAIDGKAALLQLGDLILHQGDQRADDQSGPTEGKARQLITKGLTGTRGHDQQQVVPLRGRQANRFLVGAEPLVTEAIP